MASPAVDWFRVPLQKEVLAGFTRKSDLRGWLQAGSFLLVFACTTAAATWLFTLKLWVPMLAVCYVHSLFHQMIGMAAAVHELSHGTAFRSRKVNDFFYGLFCFLTWNNPVHFRASHTLHHQFTVYRGLDKEVIQGPVRERLNPLAWLRWLTFDATWFWTLAKTMVLHALGNGDAEYFSWDPLFARDDPRRAAMIGWARFALLGYAALIAVFVVFKLWVLVYLVVFGSFFATVVGNLTGSIQHLGLSSSVPDWRLVCHTVRVNPLVAWLYWNMNYHAEHHMYAAVPFWQLPRFHQVLKSRMQEPVNGFIAGLKLVHSIKRRQKEDPSFIHVPRFPGGAPPPKWK
jgi:fatty acid desaturase